MTKHVPGSNVHGVTPDVLRDIMENHIPFNRLLGIRVTTIEVGFVRMEIPFRDELIGDVRRPAIHGGVISSLADAAGGAAVWVGLPDAHARVSTIDLRIDYLLPGKPETLVVDAKVVRVGNRVGVADMRLYQPSDPDATVATGKGVYNIAQPKRT
jgi:uncharacterized protein (TIGR00369 family)